MLQLTSVTLDLSLFSSNFSVNLDFFLKDIEEDFINQTKNWIHSNSFNEKMKELQGYKL